MPFHPLLFHCGHPALPPSPGTRVPGPALSGEYPDSGPPEYPPGSPGRSWRPDSFSSLRFPRKAGSSYPSWSAIRPRRRCSCCNSPARRCRPPERSQRMRSASWRNYIPTGPRGFLSQRPFCAGLKSGLICPSTYLHRCSLHLRRQWQAGPGIHGKAVKKTDYCY